MLKINCPISHKPLAPSLPQSHPLQSLYPHMWYNSEIAETTSAHKMYSWSMTLSCSCCLPASYEGVPALENALGLGHLCIVFLQRWCLGVHQGYFLVSRQRLLHCLSGLHGLPLLSHVLLQHSACTPSSPPRLPWPCQSSWIGRPPAEIMFSIRLQTPWLSILNILWRLVVAGKLWQ